MAIVHEDVRIVKLLLDHGADVHERCLGSFFLPNDQKDRANTNLRKCLNRAKANACDVAIDLHSNELLTPETDYVGSVYSIDFYG